MNDQVSWGKLTRKRRTPSPISGSEIIFVESNESAVRIEIFLQIGFT